MAAPPITPTPEAVERNTSVVRLRSEGLTWTEIAGRVGCSERTARRRYAAFLRSAAIASLEDVDSEAIVTRVLRSHLRALDRLERLTGRADNDNARLGAARALASVGVSLLDVLTRVGLLGDPGLYRFQNELRMAAAAVVTLADEYDIPEERVSKALAQIPRSVAA